MGKSKRGWSGCSEREKPIVGCLGGEMQWAELVSAMRRASLDIARLRCTRHPFFDTYRSPVSPRPPISLSCPAELLFTSWSTSLIRPTASLHAFPSVIGRTWPTLFFFFHHLIHLSSSSLISSRYVRPRTQAGPATPCSPSCL